MNTKVLFLTVTLIISHLINTADIPQSKLLLEKIMREHFNRGATDQDLIEARDTRGYTIFHVLVEKIALAPHTSDWINLLKARASIAQPVIEQVNQTLQKEGRSTKVDLNSLLKQYESNPEKSELIKANMALLNLIVTYQRENATKYGGLGFAIGCGIGILCTKCFNL